MHRSWGFVIAVVLVGFGRPSADEPGAPEIARSGEPIVEPDAGPIVEAAGPAEDVEATPMEPSLRAAVVRTLMDEASGDARYAFEREAGSVVAMHPSQDLRARFEAEELTLSDERGEHPIRVSLREINGRPAGRASMHTNGNRVELRRDALTEWYVHGSLGFEQGFTLERAPSGEADEVVLEVAVAAPGYVVAERDGAIELSHDERAVLVRDFYAEDATGRPLEARMAWRTGTVELHVNVEGARYPVVIDPMWSQETKLAASDATLNDFFGHSVALSGDTAVVGTPFDAGRGPNSGSAYVFVRSGMRWTQEAKLVASDALEDDQFGTSVAVFGDTAVVSAPFDDDDEDGPDSGSAYVFVRSGTSWTEQAKLVASDAAWGDMFGRSVAVSGDTAVIGAPFDDDDNSGSAYVFVRSGTSWTQERELVASDAGWGDNFGLSVAVSGDTAVVGAPGNDDGGSDSGSAYVFVRSGTSWTQEAKLVASDAADFVEFGRSVAVSGDTAVVGAPGSRRGGSVYVFVRSGTSWTEEAELVAMDAAPLDNFGLSVALLGDTAVIGAPFDDDEAGSNSGSAYVFVRSGTSWTQERKLVASEAAAEDYFGESVAVSGDTAVVGAPADDDAGDSSGSAYVFVRTSGCGDGVLEAAEACDDGNTLNGDCCSSTCGFEASTVVCRASAGPCDVAEMCSGTWGACPADRFAPDCDVGMTGEDAARGDASFDGGVATTSEGCSCAVPGHRTGGRGPALFALSLLSVLTVRRRRN